MSRSRTDKSVSQKISRMKVKKVGVKSIHDLIHNTPELSPSEKIDYIRHVYTFYDGNTGFFYNADNTPNARRAELNLLIEDILSGKKDPSCLKDINKEVLAWRIEKDREEYEKEQLRLKNIVMPKNLERCTLSIASQDSIYKWRRQTSTNEMCSEYVKLIEAFLEDSPDYFKDDELENISYKELKKIARCWFHNKTKDENFKFEGSFLENEQMKEEFRAQKRAEELMRQYAQDLGYIQVEESKEEIDEAI